MLKGNSEGDSLADQQNRCPTCGRDVEQMWPNDITVSHETMENIAENTEGKGVKILKIEEINRFINLKLDDLTLKPIHGPAADINLRQCRRCITKIGFRHKHLKKHKLKSYSTFNL